MWFGGVIAVAWLTGYFVGDYFYGKSEEPQEEWCEVGQVMSDGTIVYNGYGPTALVVLATTEGPKLMAKCE